MDDFKAKVGVTSKDNRIRNIVGKYGSGENHKHTSPDGNHKNQIDYILTRSPWRLSVTNAKYQVQIAGVITNY